MEKRVRALIRVWWRPASCVGIAAGIFVNVIALPIARGEPIDLTGFAAVIASCATVFAVREWGKINGAE